MANANRPSAYLEATQLLVKYIEDSKKLPFVCKNLAIDQIQKSMEVLKNAIGCIELSARRGDGYGISNSKEELETCRDKKNG